MTLAGDWLRVDNMGLRDTWEILVYREEWLQRRTEEK
jgi:hypothetical protein